MMGVQLRQTVYPAVAPISDRSRGVVLVLVNAYSLICVGLPLATSWAGSYRACPIWSPAAGLGIGATLSLTPAWEGWGGEGWVGEGLHLEGSLRWKGGYAGRELSREVSLSVVLTSYHPKYRVQKKRKPCSVLFCRV